MNSSIYKTQNKNNNKNEKKNNDNREGLRSCSNKGTDREDDILYTQAIEESENDTRNGVPSTPIAERNTTLGTKVPVITLTRVTSTGSVHSLSSLSESGRTVGRAQSIKDSNPDTSRANAKETCSQISKGKRRRDSESHAAISIGEETDESEERIPKVPPQRKIGRPETTGEYKLMCARREKAALEEEIRAEREILDPLVKPKDTKSYKNFLESIQDKEEEYMERPIPDLEALVAEKADVIFKVATDSKRLKGTMVKEAKQAAAAMCAAASAPYGHKIPRMCR